MESARRKTKLTKHVSCKVVSKVKSLSVCTRCTVELVLCIEPSLTQGLFMAMRVPAAFGNVSEDPKTD